MDISNLRKLCEEDSIRWTDHVMKRLLLRGISQADVLQAVYSGEIIENYPDDYPYPSCLLLESDTVGKPLHVVCGRGPEEIWIITVYHPDPEEWESDLKTRKVIK